jgi:hypothetical protein
MSDIEAKRALLRDLLAKRAAAPRRAPASFAQERLWFLDRLSPGSAFYNVEAAIPIDTAVDADVLERAVNEIVRRHGALRTTFQDEGGGVVQVVAPELHVSLQRIDLRALSLAERDEAQLAIRRERARTVFDLERGAANTDRSADTRARHRYLFLLNMHHIVTDGWSMGVFSRELTAVYAALVAGKPPDAAAVVASICGLRGLAAPRIFGRRALPRARVLAHAASRHPASGFAYRPGTSASAESSRRFSQRTTATCKQ